MDTPAKKKISLESEFGQCQYDEGTETKEWNMPALVILRMLQLEKSIQFAKLCRLISKEWNQVACQYLRQHSKVTLDEKDSVGIETFLELILERQLGLEPNFPCPYQDYEVNVTNFKDKIFTSMVAKKQVKVTTLSISPTEDFNFGVLHKFLKKDDPIKSLNIFAHESVVFDISSFPLRLPLTTFVFRDNCRKTYCCCHTTFIRDILEHHTLSSVTIIVDAKNLVSQMLPALQTRTLSTLILLCLTHPGLSDEDVSALTSLETLPALTSLIIFTGAELNQSNREKLHTLLSRVDNQLMELNYDLGPNDIRVTCPKLRSMETIVRRPCDFGWYSLERFPQLQDVQITFVKDVPFLPMDFRPEKFPPHPEVLSLTVAWCQTDLIVRNADGPVRYIPNNQVRDVGPLFKNVFMCLRRQFPNVRQLVVRLTTFPRNFFLVIVNCFPLLTALTLDGECSFPTFTGLDSVGELTEMGWTAQEIIRSHSIADLKELKQLTLMGKFELTEDMKTYGSNLLPNLDILENAA